MYRVSGTACVKHRADIDGLRALSVLSVILFHLDIAAFSGGFVGVDVFFVISGYVIAKSLEDDLANGRFSILHFYNKRIRRIFPALFAVFLVTWAIAYILLLPKFFLGFTESLAAASAFVSNFLFWRQWGYFAPDKLVRPLLHTWSLAVEEQYYIFAPMMTWAVWRFFGRRWLIVLAPLAAISLILSILGASLAPTADFFLLPGRAWELLLGALLAHRPPPALRSRILRESAGVAGLALIAYPVFHFSQATAFPGVNALYPCLGALLLIYLGQSAPASAVNNLLSRRFPVWCGKISYSLYLVHWPAIVFFYILTMGPPKPVDSILILFVTFLLAWLSWRFVEQPFRNPEAKDWPDRRVVIGGMSVAAAFCLIGAVGISARGFPARFPDFVPQAIADAAHVHWNAGACFRVDDLDYSRWNPQTCTITKGGPERALLWGDSHAAHYVTGIRANADKIPFTIIQYNGGACPPILNFTGFQEKDCRRFNGNALKIIRDNDIKTVILSARWVAHKSEVLAGLRETLATLDKMGVRIFVIGQSPEFAIDPDVIYYYRRKHGIEPLDMANVYFDSGVNDQLSGIAGASRFIDPMKILCRDSLCPYRDEKNFFFEDSGHLSDAGSDLFVRKYFPLVRQVQ
jgi:peptidoglycan/LPS O-acetylase OafA/YrhL